MTGRAIDIVVIGGGIVGLAAGLEVTRRYPGLSLAIVEKEAALASHQTSHNSGVIHSGIYYKPGSMKAKLCVEGAAALVRFCQEHGVPHEICGKVIVASTEDELPKLEILYQRGQGNGLRDLRMLSSEEISEKEPHASGLRGIWVPGTGIVEYAKVSAKYAECVTQAGGAIHLRHEVIGLKRSGGNTIVETTSGALEARLVINCAGLHSDRVSRMADAKIDIRIVPFRGEYYELATERRHLIKGLLYPVPAAQHIFLGVHFTRRMGGGVEAGPNAVLALEREGYTKSSFRTRDILDYAAFPGFWKMAAKQWQTCVSEYHRSLSKAAFVRALQKLVPSITSDDLAPGGSGVRAQALGSNGELLDDFHFVYTDGIVHVCNVPSPAATASLAIGRHIVDIVTQRHGDMILP